MTLFHTSNLPTASVTEFCTYLVLKKLPSGQTKANVAHTHPRVWRLLCWSLLARTPIEAAHWLKGFLACQGLQNQNFINVKNHLILLRGCVETSTILVINEFYSQSEVAGHYHL